MKSKVLILEHDEHFVSDCRSFFTNDMAAEVRPETTFSTDTTDKQQSLEMESLEKEMTSKELTTFESDQYIFTVISDIETAIKSLMLDHFDVLVANRELALGLEVSMQQNLFAWIKSKQIDLPIIILAHDLSKENVIELLHLHTFALIEKPYSFSLLKSKIEESCLYSRGGLKVASAIHKISLEEIKGVEPHRESIPYLGIEMDFDLRMVRAGDKEITLTPSEFTILELLVFSNGRRISREEISQALWGRSVVSKNTLNTHLYNLKNKIPGLNDKLKVIYGSGYVLSPNPAAY